MKALGIMGSPRKGQATDRLVEAALAGFLDEAPTAQVRNIPLVDLDLRHCRNCLACRNSPASPYAPCRIEDDMAGLYPELAETDALVMGTPVHMGSVTGLMLCFLERVCWTFARPGRRVLTVDGCPVPRSPRRRAAVILVVSGLVPPYLRYFCDEATALIRTTLRDSLNCRMAGDMYAGAVERRGVERYLDKARSLGRDLARAAAGLAGA